MAVAKIGEVTYETLADAIAAANATGSESTIILISDIEFSSEFVISNNITLDGYHTITRATSYTGTFMSINRGVSLTLKNVIIDGSNNWSFDKVPYEEALYNGTRIGDVDAFTTFEENSPIATSGMFILNGSMSIDGVTIKDHVGAGGASVFRVASGATLTMNNSTITHIYAPTNNCIAYLSGGSTWTINDGTIINNCHGGHNGSLCRCDNSSIIMNGGLITNNTAVNSSGTAFMFYGENSYFEFNGGEISGNSGVAGVNNSKSAPIYLHSSGQMLMTGGIITSNVGVHAGGITYKNSSSTLIITGGYVGGNVAVIDGYEDDIQANDNTQISGGTFTQDVSQWCVNGYGLVQFDDGTWGVKTTRFQAYACVDGIIYKADMYACMNGTIYKVNGIQSRLDLR